MNRLATDAFLAPSDVPPRSPLLGKRKTDRHSTMALPMAGGYASTVTAARR